MAIVIYALITVLAVASPAAAQSTRVEAIAEPQAQKTKQTGPEGPSEAEMIIHRVLLSPLLSGGEDAYPWFGSGCRSSAGVPGAVVHLRQRGR